MSTTVGVQPQSEASTAAAQIPARQLPFSSLTCKYIMAITGLGLTGFVLMHMLGNLQVFLGREVLNHYAHFLKGNPELLWPARIGLLVLLVVHMVLGINLAIQNHSARPVAYAFPRHFEAANVASRTMVWTGLVILAFLIYHLMHFTVGLTNPADFKMIDPHWKAGDPLSQQHDVYGMVIKGFSNPVIVITYIIAQLFLGLHLWHAVPSMFQSLGINRPRWGRGIEIFGAAFTVVVVGGNILIPLLILCRIYPNPV